MGGTTYVRYYSPFSYHGLTLSSYVPAAYYQPGFYAWVGQPWGVGVSFSWGWTSQPWYTASSGYFNPDPSYPSSALWITDYVLASNLSDGYQVQNGSRPLSAISQTTVSPTEGGPMTPINPAVKQAIASEFRTK